MMRMTIETALETLGFPEGWAASDHGIILWENPEPQPTEQELIAAGWIKIPL